jgi:putative Ca2+/H+ antiporter (TMEM165/GDT1 family)
MDELLKSFVFVFLLIGGLELADRTNFALIGLAAKYRPLSVWGGASLAFIVTTAASVAIGQAILAAVGSSNVIYLRLGGGILLLGYAAYLVLVPEKDRRPPTGRSAFSTAFLLILLLELGDTTMIFTVLYAATMPSAVVVGLAAGLALVLVASSACLIGWKLGAKVEPRSLERLVIVILATVGVITIAYALDPGAFPAIFQ